MRVLLIKKIGSIHHTKARDLILCKKETSERW